MKFRRLGDSTSSIVCRPEQKVFKERLNAGVDRNALRSVGRGFLACGAATENILSPSSRRVLGTTKVRQSSPS